jgi:hypothetical protein
MRTVAAIALLAALALTAASCGSGLFREYEYEEEIYLALDGSATIYVNASVPALNALRGSTFDPNPAADIDREAVRAFFTTAVTRVTRRPSLSRRNNRRYVHVRLDVDQISQLTQTKPFSWSTYTFAQDGNLFTYRQTIGAPAVAAAGAAGWDGTELVAFRVHQPSTIVYHNAGAGNPKRGNILVWEQSLADRLRGEPLALDARIESQSILSRTLLLFAATLVAVAITFGLILWWVVRRPGNVRK